MASGEHAGFPLTPQHTRKRNSLHIERKERYVENRGASVGEPSDLADAVGT